MKAAVNNIYGWPEIIQILDRDTPTPSPTQVLVKISASTVNRSDCGVLTGKPYLIRAFTWLCRPKRHIWWSDFVGTVEFVWEDVSRFKTWDVVFGFHDEWLQSHAEFLVIQEDGNIAHMPSWADPIHVVASMEWGHYALQDLKQAPVVPGMQVLVNGASGAIGSSLTQLYSIWWGIVTGIAHQENEDKIMQLGAKYFVDYTTEDILEQDKKYDIILDTVWNISYLRAKPLLKQWWTYLSSELWPARENIRYSIITKFFGKKKCKFALPSDIKTSMKYFSDLLEQREYKPLIDEQTYTLDDIRSAYEYVMTGHKTWSVILMR